MKQRKKTNAKRGSVYIGTSGWSYKGWHELFYPKEIKRDHLKYFSKHYNSVEVNSTFYRLQPKSFFEKWKGETPPDFVFAVKLNRYFTHIKKMGTEKSRLKYFFENAKGLGKKWEVLLIQLPPRLTFHKQKFLRFVDKIKKEIKTLKIRGLKIALEPRHATWFEEP